MSLRYSNGAIIKPGFNPVLVPGAPTIGAVTGGDTQVIVAFTAPTDTGGSAITSYQVVSSPGSVVATGASSPITVTGLTNGTAYTFRVAAVNSYGAGTFSAASASVTPAVVQGQQAFTTQGTFSWVAPTGVTSVSVVAVGAGGGGAGRDPGVMNGGGGGGGALAYINNYTVTPGSSYTVVVGVNGCAGASGQNGAAGGQSYFVNTSTVNANGGNGGTRTGSCVSGGTVTAGTGGAGGVGANGDDGANRGGGGGGAGGYAGAGGKGAMGSTNQTTGQNGAGGGGGGGGRAIQFGTSAGGGGGGGVGILGQGCNGAGGVGTTFLAVGGGGGSGGSQGQSRCGCLSQFTGGNGGVYGGGGGGASRGQAANGGTGSAGAVRIIWPGTTRSFPSTNTGNL